VDTVMARASIISECSGALGYQSIRAGTREKWL